MKQTFGIIIIFIFFSCTNGKKNNVPDSDNQKSENQFGAENDYQPIFLKLSPQMSDFQFEQEVSHSIPNKKFTIPLYNYNFDFDVTKKSNRIVLDYNDIRTLVFTPKFGDNAEKRYLDFIKKEPIEKNEILIKEFIILFKNKYSKQINDLPLLKNQKGEYYNNPNGISAVRNLHNYGFEKENYLIFQDSIKTVIIGYTNAEYPQKLDKKALEKITYTSETSDRESLNPIMSVEEIREHFKEFDKLSPYKQALELTDFEEQISRKKGLSFEINYMPNSDFEYLKKRIIKSNKEFNYELRQKDSLRKIKLKKEKSNLNKI
tara:strand:+ start:31 stop:984 length:954 start_codon:yes stop_codon:yes gene_type:complete